MQVLDLVFATHVGVWGFMVMFNLGDNMMTMVKPLAVDAAQKVWRSRKGVAKAVARAGCTVIRALGSPLRALRLVR